MVLILGALVTLFLLVLLYRYMPRRIYFFGFLVLLVACSAVVHHIAAGSEGPRPMTEAERTALLHQQEIFSVWDGTYQKQIDELDRNWQWYHQILEEYKEGDIDTQTVYIRLNQLENDSQQAMAHAVALAPPKELDAPAYDLVASICQKTAEYAKDQYKTIALTRAACDPAQQKENSPGADSPALQAVMNRESPPALFIADELSQIHTLLATPKDEETE